MITISQWMLRYIDSNYLCCLAKDPGVSVMYVLRYKRDIILFHIPFKGYLGRKYQRRARIAFRIISIDSVPSKDKVLMFFLIKLEHFI